MQGRQYNVRCFWHACGCRYSCRCCMTHQHFPDLSAVLGLCCPCWPSRALLTTAPVPCHAKTQACKTCPAVVKHCKPQGVATTAGHASDCQAVVRTASQAVGCPAAAALLLALLTRAVAAVWRLPSLASSCVAVPASAAAAVGPCACWCYQGLLG